jgi:hypothetical protein
MRCSARSSRRQERWHGPDCESSRGRHSASPREKPAPPRTAWSRFAAPSPRTVTEHHNDPASLTTLVRGRRASESDVTRRRSATFLSVDPDASPPMCAGADPGSELGLDCQAPQEDCRKHGAPGCCRLSVMRPATRPPHADRGIRWGDLDGTGGGLWGAPCRAHTSATCACQRRRGGVLPGAARDGASATPNRRRCVAGTRPRSTRGSATRCAARPTPATRPAPRPRDGALAV